MRTDAEILARIEHVKPMDWMGIMTADLVGYLPFEAAQPFLKPEAKAEDWPRHPRDRESILKQMREYMPFAWDKANNCRGISASRSMNHYSIWVWMLGDDLGELNDYEFYGKDQLVLICTRYCWDYTKWDDGVRVNSELEL